MAEKSIEKAPSKEKAPAPRRAVPALFSFERDLERLFDDFHRLGWWWKPERRLFRQETAFIQPPAVDVVDEKNEVVVKAELPGLSKDDVTVELANSTLVIKGEKKREKEVKEEHYYCSEREYGSVYRSIDLPSEVKAQDVKATYKDGVLEIHLPKTEEAKHKAVKITVQ